MDADWITLSPDNLDDEHLCCAISDPKHQRGVAQKRAWLRERLDEGLVFRKLDVRGKVFIEYMPAEMAWRPIVAPGWLVIHCLWVSGRYGGRGYGRALLQGCIDDARRSGKQGVVVAAGKRKRPFLVDPGFIRHFGFNVVDTTGEFDLLALRTNDGPTLPRFADAVSHPPRANDGVFRIQMTPQCPFGTFCSGHMAGALQDADHQVEIEPIDTREAAQNTASPLGAFGMQRNGALVLHHPTTPGGIRRALATLDDE